MEAKLNRERKNVGREVYRERIIDVLEGSRSKIVRDRFAEQKELENKLSCEELTWEKVIITNQ